MKEPERWMELCALAAKERDPKKLVELTEHIIRALDERTNRLIHPAKPSQNP